MAPWLSVILPTHNGRAFLTPTLESLAAQDRDGVEFIALDDGSTDGTLELLGSYAERLRLRVERIPPVGNLAGKFNIGLRLAAGTFACVLPQDDLWHPDRLRILRPVLEKHPSTTLLVHPVWYVDAHGRRLGRLTCPLPAGGEPSRPERVAARLLVQNFICLPGVLFHREAALRVGGIEPDLWYAGDWDLYLKLLEPGEFRYLGRPLALYRLHGNAMTLSRSRAREEFRRQLEVVLDRHLPRWEGRLPNGPEIARAARFSVSVNLALAGAVHGDRMPLAGLAAEFAALGPSGWHRFVRDSRIVERVRPRLELGLAKSRSD